MADSRFPTTTLSIIFGLQSDDTSRRALSLERLATAYWKPVYKYVRMRWQKPVQEAEEITQEFFLRAIGKETFHGYDANKARFRTFVRVCLDRFVLDMARHDRAKKRGDGILPVSLDFAAAETEIDGAAVDDPERFFEAEWVRSLFEASVAQLRAACLHKGYESHFRAFERFHLTEADEAKPSYAAIAEELGLSIPEVTYRLQYARREFRAIVLLTLRELTSNDEEFRSEAHLVLGIEL